MPKKLQESRPEDDYKYIPIDDNKNFMFLFDLGASVSLVTAGAELVSLEKTNPRKALFIFHRTPKNEKIVEDYWAGRLEVGARAFFDNLKATKNRLYSD